MNEARKKQNENRLQKNTSSKKDKNMKTQHCGINDITNMYIANKIVDSAKELKPVIFYIEELGKCKIAVQKNHQGKNVYSLILKVDGDTEVHTFYCTTTLKVYLSKKNIVEEWEEDVSRETLKIDLQKFSSVTEQVDTIDNWDMLDLKDKLKEDLKIYIEDYELNKIIDEDEKDNARLEMINDFLDTHLTNDLYGILSTLIFNGNIELNKEWEELVYLAYDELYNEYYDDIKADLMQGEGYDEEDASEIALETIGNMLIYTRDIIDFLEKYTTEEIENKIIDLVVEPLTEIVEELYNELEEENK